MSRGKRLVIYFFYDKDGIADRYVDYFLNGLAEVTDKFIIVSNGRITHKSRDLFLKYTTDIIVRENKGLDVWAYKTALEYEGWDNLKEYYEVCLVNSTIMGPVYPFSEMFNKMDTKEDLDFWGVSRYLKCDLNPYNNPYGYLPEHVQSHFTVYRNKFLNTKVLKEYWDNIPNINSYEDSVGKHESFFTKYFEDQGFKWDTYVNNEKERQYSDYYLMVSPKKSIEIDRCPIFKRRCFFHSKNDFLNWSTGEQSCELFSYLKYNTKYDVDMILENIIRTCHQIDFVQNLALYYLLPTTSVANKISKNIKVALVMHLYYEECINEAVHYAEAIPDTADLYIHTPQSRLIDIISNKFSKFKNRLKIVLVENRGRDVSSLLVGSKNVYRKYKYICFYHDKKSMQIKPLSVGRSFSYLISECVLHNKDYVERLIETFEKNKYLGLLTAIPPHHSIYNDTIGGEWSNNFNNTKKLYNELNLRVPISEDKPPIAPFGTVFWFRSAAFRPLFEQNLTFEDFPAEPNNIDGTILHAYERIYSFVAQNEGYYSGYVLPDYLAAIVLDNMIQYVRAYNKVTGCHQILGGNTTKVSNVNYLLYRNRNLLLLINDLPTLIKLKIIIKIIFPKWFYLRIVKIKRFLLGPRNIPISHNV